MVQRAVKTPATMASEMAKGDRPELTSLVGASAAPSQTPAARAQATPRAWREVKGAGWGLVGVVGLLGIFPSGAKARSIFLGCLCTG